MEQKRAGKWYFITFACFSSEILLKSSCSCCLGVTAPAPPLLPCWKSQLGPGQGDEEPGPAPGAHPAPGALPPRPCRPCELGVCWLWLEVAPASPGPTALQRHPWSSGVRLYPKPGLHSGSAPSPQLCLKRKNKPINPNPALAKALRGHSPSPKVPGRASQGGRCPMNMDAPPNPCLTGKPPPSLQPEPDN